MFLRQNSIIMFPNFLNKILQIKKKERLARWLVVIIMLASIIHFGQPHALAQDASSSDEHDSNPTTDTTATLIEPTSNESNSAETSHPTTTIETLANTLNSMLSDIASTTGNLIPDNEENIEPTLENSTSTIDLTGATSTINSTSTPASTSTDPIRSSLENSSSTNYSFENPDIINPLPFPTSTIPEESALNNSSSTTPQEETRNSEENNSQSMPPPAATEGGPTITTGNAFSAANILNVINTNITDSNGFLSFLNLFNPFIGNIDVSHLDFPLDHCTGDGCNLKAIVSNNSTSTISNNVTVEANTGSNVAVGEASIIRTGASVASANVTNIVNTNIISSNYLLLVLNNFNEWVGDLVLPGKDFFANLLNQSQNVSGGSEGVNDSSTDNILNNNSASVINDVQTIADTGNNRASGNNSVINTGQAQAATNLFSMVNSNITGNDSAFILIQVFGNWSGQIFSPPPGISWKKTPHGILLYSTPQGANAGFQNATSSCCGNNSEITNSNSADVENKIQVFSLTGENKVDGNDSAISTGDAVAVANISNIVNTNIVGRNWLLAIANIFGDWQGNLTFGRPDLWIGQRAEVSANQLISGSEITYIINLMNRGNADATNIDITSSYNPSGRIEITNTSGGEQKDGILHWTLPSLSSGASTTITYTARVGSDLPPGVTTLTTNTTTTSFETDADPTNNSDSLALTLQGPPIVTATAGGGGGSGGTNEYGNGLPKISMTKTNDTTEPIAPSSTVKYKLHITNDGTGSAFGVVVKDTLYDPWGTKVVSNSWPLDIIYPNEEILIDYETNFSVHASSGYYINIAQLEGDNFYRDDLPPTSASSSVYLINPNDKINENAGNTTATQISDGDSHATGNATSTTNNILPTISAISASPKPNANGGLNVALATNNSPIVPENAPSRSNLSSLLASLKDTVGSNALLILIVALIALVALIRFSKKVS